MSAVLEPLLSNALVATLLASLVAAVALARPRPALLLALWLIVLVKFVTPQFVRFELPWNAIGFDGGLQAEAGHAVNSLPADRGKMPDVAHGRMVSADIGATASLADENARTVMDSVAPPQPLTGEPPAPATSFDGPRPRAHASGEGASESPLTIMAALSTIWLAGSAAWFSVAGVRLARFHRQLRRTRPAGHSLQSAADQVARQMGLRRRPRVQITEATLPPMLASLAGRGLILLPSELLRGLSPSQQAAIIAHELAHFRRGDHWTRWLELVVIGLYWWHPVAWLARRQLQQAEELCCDAWVIRVFPDRAKYYAQAFSWAKT
ncbi:MAG TPA: M56 family metallopeptidase [Pirellulales bacterium]|nr:M56 family metallopeptidase [Pirellulales bacterium]